MIVIKIKDHAQRNGLHKQGISGVMTYSLSTLDCLFSKDFLFGYPINLK